jgi:sulfur carrier protein
VIVSVNGEATEIEDGATVAAVVKLLDLPGIRRGIAVAVNAEVVPRAEWEERVLAEGERVEVVSAVQGG